MFVGISGRTVFVTLSYLIITQDIERTRIRKNVELIGILGKKQAGAEPGQAQYKIG